MSVPSAHRHRPDRRGDEIGPLGSIRKYGGSSRVRRRFWISVGSPVAWSMANTANRVLATANTFLPSKSVNQKARLVR